VRKTLGNYPELSKATAQKIKNAQLVELDDICHMPHSEAFGRFIDPLLRFLKSDNTGKE
jgi:pimeloyl-ACP methyl ester carboxylesterase